MGLCRVDPCSTSVWTFSKLLRNVCLLEIMQGEKFTQACPNIKRGWGCQGYIEKVQTRAFLPYELP